MPAPRKIMWLFIIVIGLTVITIVTEFFVSEWSRDRTLKSLEAPNEYIERYFREEGTFSAGVLMQGSETLVCAIDSYTDPQRLSWVNEKQKKTISKDMLPSSDLSWYLLFFNEEGISRIYLMNHQGKWIENLQSNACASRRGLFTINGENDLGRDYFSFNIINYGI